MLNIYKQKTMPKLINKLDEVPKVAEKGALLPAHQSVHTAGQDSYITIPATPAPATTILGSGNSYYFDLESDEVGRIDELCLRFRVACVSLTLAVVVAAPDRNAYDNFEMHAAEVFMQCISVFVLFT